MVYRNGVHIWTRMKHHIFYLQGNRFLYYRVCSNIIQDKVR